MSLESTEIVPGLWMGSQGPIPVITGDWDLVVSLREIPDVSFMGITEFFTQGGPMLCWVPILDVPIEVPWWKVEAALELIHSAMGNGKKVLVHCAQGHNRSGLIVGSYLVEHMDYQPADAIALIRDKRPGALTNEVFVKQIEQLILV